MMKRTVCSLLVGVAVWTVGAGEQILYKSDFAKAENLSGWTDATRQNPPDGKYYKLETDGDGKIMTTDPKVGMGLSHRLDKPLKIDEKVSSVTVEISFLQPTPLNGYPIRMALSSRETTAPENGGPFAPKKDSGVMAYGYGHNIQKANFLCFQIDGQETKFSPAAAPFNFLERIGAAASWRMVYDNEEKSLSFFRNSAEVMPFLQMMEVDLNGVELKSVWVGGFGVRYSSIVVSCDVIEE